MMTDFKTIELKKLDGCFVIILNRPSSYNSINTQMHKDLKTALRTVRKEDCRALLLTGKGKGFCSGQDLNDRSQDAEKVDLGDSLENKYNPLIRSLIQLPFPTVCAVNGVAAGAGASLALACDIVIASEQASFIQAFSKIGLAPDSGSTWLLPRLIGNARAVAMMMLAEKITANQAVEWGMIWKMVEASDLEQESMGLLGKLAKMPTQSLRQIKAAVHYSWYNSLNQQLDLERDLQSLLGFTEDYQEGVDSFLAKKTPEFKGK